MSVGGVQPISEQQPQGIQALAQWALSMALAINQMLRGKLNATTTLTLRASQTTTTLTDSRIGATSVILLSPLTANAQTAWKTHYIPAATTLQGSAVIQHASAVAADQTFSVVIITG